MALFGKIPTHLIDRFQRFRGAASSANSRSRRRRRRLLALLVKLPATVGNETVLLRHGEEIFASMFDGIEKARDYILVQFYIVRDDTIGRELQRRLAGPL